MANPKNLIPGGYKLSLEEASKGGKASVKARREKADLRKVIQTWLGSEATTNKNGEPMTGAELMAMVAVKEMSKGSARHWELLRDTAGYKPVDKIMVADVDQDVINAVESEVKEALGADGEED